MRLDSLKNIFKITKIAKVELASMGGNNFGNSLTGKRGFYWEEDGLTILFCDGNGNWSVAIKSDGNITALKEPFEAIPEREVYSVKTPGPSDSAASRFVEIRNAEKKRIADKKAADAAKEVPTTKPPEKVEKPVTAPQKDSPDAWKAFGDKAESVKDAWIKRSTKLRRYTTYQNFKLWLTKNSLEEKIENADKIISKLYGDMGLEAPATTTPTSANATTAPAGEKPKEEPAKKEEAKPQAATEFTDKEKRLALALSAMGNQKLVGTKGFDLVRELPRINAIASFVGSWENMARVVLTRNPSLGPSMPTDLGKDGVMIDKEYADKNLKWFQLLQTTINAVYESSEKKGGIISRIPRFTVEKELPKKEEENSAKADDGLRVKSSIKNREYRVSALKRIIANS